MDNPSDYPHSILHGFNDACSQEAGNCWVYHLNDSPIFDEQLGILTITFQQMVAEDINLSEPANFQSQQLKTMLYAEQVIRKLAGIGYTPIRETTLHSGQDQYNVFTLRAEANGTFAYSSEVKLKVPQGHDEDAVDEDLKMIVPNVDDLLIDAFTERRQALLNELNFSGDEVTKARLVKIAGALLNTGAFDLAQPDADDPLLNKLKLACREIDGIPPKQTNIEGRRHV